MDNHFKCSKKKVNTVFSVKEEENENSTESKKVFSFGSFDSCFYLFKG